MLLGFHMDFGDKKNFHVMTKLCQVIWLSLKRNSHSISFFDLHIWLSLKKNSHCISFLDLHLKIIIQKLVKNFEHSIDLSFTKKLRPSHNMFFLTSLNLSG